MLNCKINDKLMPDLVTKWAGHLLVRHVAQFLSFTRRIGDLETVTLWLCGNLKCLLNHKWKIVTSDTCFYSSRICYPMSSLTELSSSADPAVLWMSQALLCLAARREVSPGWRAPSEPSAPYESPLDPGRAFHRERPGLFPCCQVELSWMPYSRSPEPRRPPSSSVVPPSSLALALPQDPCPRPHNRADLCCGEGLAAAVASCDLQDQAPMWVEGLFLCALIPWEMASVISYVPFCVSGAVINLCLFVCSHVFLAAVPFH